MPPSVTELHRRLVERGTETPEVIASRMARGMEEAKVIDQYDFLVVNDQIDECVERLHGTIVSAHYAAKRNIETINKIKSEFEQFFK